jgi:hypothetical protein
MRQSRSSALSVVVLDYLLAIYRWVMPLLAGLGLLAALAATLHAVRIRQISPMLVVAVSAWVFVATRVALLALLHATAMPGINHLYAAPGSFMLAVAAVLSLAVFAERGVARATRATSDS